MTALDKLLERHPAPYFAREFPARRGLATVYDANDVPIMETKAHIADGVVEAINSSQPSGWRPISEAPRDGTEDASAYEIRARYKQALRDIASSEPIPNPPPVHPRCPRGGEAEGSL